MTVAWSSADEARVKELREIKHRELTTDERAELAALRRRETVEAFNRRRKWLRGR